MHLIRVIVNEDDLPSSSATKLSVTKATKLRVTMSSAQPNACLVAIISE